MGLRNRYLNRACFCLPLMLAMGWPVGRVLEIMSAGKHITFNTLEKTKKKVKLAFPATLTPAPEIPNNEMAEHIAVLASDTDVPTPQFRYIFSCHAVTRDVPTPPPRCIA